MSEASDRAAALMAGPPGDDLAAGARVRTQLAVGAAAAALLRAQDPPVGAGDLTGGGGRGAGAGDPGARGDGAGGDGAGGDGAGPRRTAGPVRWLVGPRLAVGAGVVLLALGVVAGWRAVAAASESVLVSLEQPAGPLTDGSPQDGPSAHGELAIHVVGAVRRPGVVTVPVGSRVVDAVEAAGGADDSADLGAVNLARLLGDGEQVTVPVAAAPGQATPGQAAGDGLLDLNTADAAALDQLPGIGPVLAGRIVAWRTEHGRFSSVDELAEVSGIGQALLAGLRDRVRV